VRLMLLLLAAFLALMGTSQLVSAAPPNTCPCTVKGSDGCGVGCVSCASEARSCECTEDCGPGQTLCDGDTEAYCDVPNLFYEISRTLYVATCRKFFLVQLTTCHVPDGCQTDFYEVVSE
jgi:hypothetical protein